MRECSVLLRYVDVDTGVRYRGMRLSVSGCANHLSGKCLGDLPEIAYVVRIKVSLYL